MKNENYFTKLNSIKCEIDKKNNLAYVSWSDAWLEVKKEYPNSNYIIYENQDWFPYWESKFWIDVKVWVIINDIEHIVRLPVMDWANKAMKAEKYSYTTRYWDKEVQAATQFDINKAIQRAFTKAIAMHWIWLYVFRWEDLPDEATDKPRIEETKKDFTEKEFEVMKEKTNFTNYNDAKQVIDKKYNLTLWMTKIVKQYYDNIDKWVDFWADWTAPF